MVNAETSHIMLTPLSKIMLSIIALFVIYNIMIELRRILIRKLKQRRRCKVMKICQKRAYEKWQEAFRELADWQELHPIRSSIDPEFVQLVENLLAAFKRTLRYKTAVSEYDRREIERLEDLLPFRTREFID